MAAVAEQEQGVVAVLNPAGESWRAMDAAAVTATLGLFSDSTGAPYDQDGKQCSTNPLTGAEACSYPGSRTRVYLFADSSGADFVNQHVVSGLPVTTPFPRFDGQPVQQTWTPTAVWISNPTRAVVPPTVDVEVPAYVVNADAGVRRAYRALNRTHHLFGSATAANRRSFDRQALTAGYRQVVGRAIQRTSEVNTHLQVYRIPDYAAEGIKVTHTSATVNGSPLEYFQYVPSTAGGRRVPLVLVFHGGGNHAEYQMWATGWPLLAKRHGFMVVSVNRHVERSAADVVDLLDQLVARHPNIDTTRVYASGFSMGSIKSWSLGEEFTERFAAIAPTNGSMAPGASVGGLLPTIYFGGTASPLTELPHQKYVTFSYSGQPNDVDKRLRSLFARNGVTDDYSYDASADENWGIAATSTRIARDPEFADVSAAVSEYASADGRVYTALAAVRHASHEPLGVEAEVAWRFMSRFSRNKDGDVVIGH